MVLVVGHTNQPPYHRLNSPTPVMSTGMSTGPRSVTPTMPVVLVLTPSMGLEPVSTSST